MIDFVTRRAYFEDYADTIEQLPPSMVKFGVRATCPCCGYPTLRERGMDEICDLCRWEDDGQDDRDAEVVRHGPNRNWSLTAGRDHFADLGVDSPDKQQMRDLFDAMQSTPMSEHERLWAEVVVVAERLRPVFNPRPGNE